MEDPTDEDKGSTSEVIVGKSSGSGIKITYVYFDYMDLTSLQNDTHNVYVYESNIFLTLKKLPRGSRDDFINQITEIRPLNDPIDKLVSNNLKVNEIIGEPTGTFKELVKLPRHDRHVYTPFTETIQQFINPSGEILNMDNNGIVLLNKYTTGQKPGTDGVNIRYFGTGEDDEAYVPSIDVCYKVVEKKRCDLKEGEEEITLTVEDVVTVDKSDPDANFADDNLRVGSPDGTDKTEKRILVKFSGDQFDDELYDIESISEFWLHLKFNDMVGEQGVVDRANTTIQITPVVSGDWNEGTATWTNTEMDSPLSDNVLNSTSVPANQPGKTAINVGLVDKVYMRQMVKEIVAKNHDGLVFSAVDEDSTPHLIPEFFGKGQSDYDKPELHVCVRKLTTTTTSPSPSQTHTPTYTTVSTSSTTPPHMITNCTIPKGGGRIVVNLDKYVVIHDNNKDTPVAKEGQFIQIGEAEGQGEKVILVYFDLVTAVEDAMKELYGEVKPVTVTDSRINFRFEPTENDENNEKPWADGRPVLYPLTDELDEESYWSYPWIEGTRGPQPGVDYVSHVQALFTRLRVRPETTRWIQATSTTIARYIFTQLETIKMKNHGFLMRYETASGGAPSHLINFFSPLTIDPEFHPWMDLCYIVDEPPFPCDTNDGNRLVFYDLSADTYIVHDGKNHGKEEHLYLGNSGWDGPARILVDFDTTTYASDYTILQNTTENSVFLAMHYEGPQVAKPYNDPRQMDRNLVIHPILKKWNEFEASSKVSYKSGNTKLKWSDDLMAETDDYDATEVASDKITEAEAKHVVYWDITSTFVDWVSKKRADHGVLIKDSLHESVPGYFLKFASLQNKDHTKRPYLWVCQKKPKCEPEDLPPVQYETEDGCIALKNVTLNACIAKNGACTEASNDKDSQHKYPGDYGYFQGVTALWDKYHVMRTFCKCCTDSGSDEMEVPMDCDGDGKEDRTQTFKYINKCDCQRCEEFSAQRKKRSAPSRTRLLLRSALKSMLRK